MIDSLTAQKRLAQAGFGLALVPESSVRDELRQGALVALDIPAMQTAIPITAIHRRNGYLSPAAKRLLALLTSGTLQPKVRRPVRVSQGSRTKRRRGRRITAAAKAPSPKLIAMPASDSSTSAANMRGICSR